MLLTMNRYFLLNIGDTRAYEISDEVVQLTEDHTVAAKEIKLGNLTEEQAEMSPVRVVLTRCIPCIGGRATITQIQEGARHPYHLIHTDNNGSTFYGWVDAGTFTKA